MASLPEIAGDDGVPWKADTGEGHPSLKYGGTRVRSVGDASKDFAETNPKMVGKGNPLFNIEIDDKVVAVKTDVFTEAGGQSKSWQFAKPSK